MENPIKMDDLEVSLFLETPTSCYKSCLSAATLASVMRCFPIWFASGVIQCALALVSSRDSEINKPPLILSTCILIGIDFMNIDHRFSNVFFECFSILVYKVL